MFAISKAKELAPESYNILLEKEPRENYPAHVAWRYKMSNAAKASCKEAEEEQEL
jgi:hypothetical protein